MFNDEFLNKRELSESKSQIVSDTSDASVRTMKNVQTNSADRRLPPKSINVSATLSASRHTYCTWKLRGSKSTRVTSIPASHQFIMQISKPVAYLLAHVVHTHQSDKHILLKFSQLMLIDILISDTVYGLPDKRRTRKFWGPSCATVDNCPLGDPQWGFIKLSI